MTARHDAARAAAAVSAYPDPGGEQWNLIVLNTPTRRQHRAAPDTSWHERAACKGRMELFYPGDGWAKITPSQERQAKAVCAACPVTNECLDWAYAINDRVAILGGLTPRERHEPRKRKRRNAA